jgi:hypothetical protein
LPARGCTNVIAVILSIDSIYIGERDAALAKRNFGGYQPPPRTVAALITIGRDELPHRH